MVQKISHLILTIIFVSGCNLPLDYLNTKSPDGFKFSESAGFSTAGISFEAFQQTLSPIMQQNCLGCHGDPSKPSPFMANPGDHLKLFTVVLERGYVNLSAPQTSIVVNKVGSGHNCWSNCSDNANDLKLAIELWAAQSVLGGADRKRTGSLRYTDAVLEPAQTENGTVVLQAEDGLLYGRSVVASHSKASNLKYWEGPNQSFYPNGGATREGLVDHCNKVDVFPLTPAEVIPDDNSLSVQAYSNNLYQLMQTNCASCHDSTHQFPHSIPGNPSLNHEVIKSNAFVNLTIPADSRLVKRLGEDNHNCWSNCQQNAQEMENAIAGWANEYVALQNQNPTVTAVPPQFDYFSGGSNAPSSSPYRVTELGYHPSNSNGWRPYNAGLNLKLINPYKLATYQQMVATGNYTNLNQVLLRRGAYITQAANGTPIPLINQELAGTDEVITSVFLMLPENVMNELMTLNFYAPKYNGNFYNASNNILRSVLTTDQINKIIYKALFERYLSFFFYGNALDGLRTHTLCPSSNPANCTPVIPVELFRANANSTFDNTFPFLLDGINPDQILDYVYLEMNNPNFNQNFTQNYFDATNVTVNLQNGAGVHNRYSFTENIPLRKTFTIANSDVTANFNDFFIGTPDNKYFSLAQRTPAMARYPINIRTAGNYRFWTKVQPMGPNDDSFQVRLKNSAGQIVSYYKESDGFVNPPAQSGNGVAGCIPLSNLGTSSEWFWTTFGYSATNPNYRYFRITNPGIYYLEVIEREDGMRADLVALSSDDAFKPNLNVVNEGLISDINRRILRYDISSLVGLADTYFSIEVKTFGTDNQAWLFRNPRFETPNGNIRAQNIQVEINGAYSFTDSAYTKVNVVVDNSQNILTYAPLLAQNLTGVATDNISFSFSKLEVTTDAPTVIEDDAPIPMEGVVCQHLDLFLKTIKPILFNVRLIEKSANDGYAVWANQSFPGTAGNTGTKPDFYRACIECHTEDHPYFKMTTFDDTTLCNQALSRVNFNNIDLSLLFRGVDGKFGHREFHMVQKLQANAASSDYVKDTFGPNGLYQEDWRGKVNTWTSTEINNLVTSNNLTGTDEAYVRAFRNQYKGIRFQRWTQNEINSFIATLPLTEQDPLNPTSLYNQINAANIVGEIKTSTDNLNTPQSLGQGTNLFDVVSPAETNGNGQLTKAISPINPDDHEKLFMKPTAQGNDEDFEGVKFFYKTLLKNWMLLEQQSYFQNN